MEKSIHLAIASVPMQRWKEIYDETKAFQKGTLFPELDKPFYVVEQDGEKLSSYNAENGDADSCYAMLKQIQQTSFVLDDLRLFLDTHPEDQQALSAFKAALKRKKEMMKKFAMQHYPLTVDCMADIYEQNPESSCYCWKEGPIPWEGACK